MRFDEDLAVCCIECIPDISSELQMLDLVLSDGDVCRARHGQSCISVESGKRYL